MQRVVCIRVVLETTMNQPYLFNQEDEFEYQYTTLTCEFGLIGGLSMFTQTKSSNLKVCGS